MLSEAVRGEAIVLGRSYYDFFLRAFGLPLLLLMGIGPLIAWRRASLTSLATTFRWPTGVALVTGVVLLLLGAGSSVPGLVAYTFSAFVLATIVMEFARGTRARKALGASSWPAAFGSLVSRNRRRYGGYVVHAAIVMLAIGVAGSSAFDRVARRSSSRGESMTIGDYTLVYRSLDERASAERDGDPRHAGRSARRSRPRNPAGGKERVHDRGSGLERGRHPQRSPHRRGPLRHRRADRSRRQRLLPRLRQAAREPHLARRARLPRRARSSRSGPIGASSEGSSRAPPRSAFPRRLDLGTRARCGARRRVCRRRRAPVHPRARARVGRSRRARRGRAPPPRPAGGSRSCARLRSRSSSSSTARGRSRTTTTEAQLGPLRRDVAAALQALGARQPEEGRRADGRN